MIRPGDLVVLSNVWNRPLYSGDSVGGIGGMFSYGNVGIVVSVSENLLHVHEREALVVTNIGAVGWIGTWHVKHA